jgi:hypothetical protein
MVISTELTDLEQSKEGSAERDVNSPKQRIKNNKAEANKKVPTMCKVLVGPVMEAPATLGPMLEGAATLGPVMEGTTTMELTILANKRLRRIIPGKAPP